MRASSLLREAFPGAQTRDGASFYVQHRGLWVRLEPVRAKGKRSIRLHIPLQLPLPIYGAITRSAKIVGAKTFTSGDARFDARFSLSGAPKALWREILAAPVGPELVQAFDDHAVAIWVDEGEVRTTLAHMTLAPPDPQALVHRVRAKLSAAAALAARIEGVLHHHTEAAQRSGTLPALTDQLRREVDDTRRSANLIGQIVLALLLLLIFGWVGWTFYSTL